MAIGSMVDKYSDETAQAGVLKTQYASYSPSTVYWDRFFSSMKPLPRNSEMPIHFSKKTSITSIGKLL
jgi:hypothetical protein